MVKAFHNLTLQNYPELYIRTVTSLTLLQHHHHHHFIIPTSSLVLTHCFKTQPLIVTTPHYNYWAPFFQPSFDTMGRMSLNAQNLRRGQRNLWPNDSSHCEHNTITYPKHKRKKGFLSFPCCQCWPTDSSPAVVLQRGFVNPTTFLYFLPVAYRII